MKRNQAGRTGGQGALDVTECYKRLRIANHRLEVRNRWIELAKRCNHCDRIDTARQLRIYDKSLVLYRRLILRRVLNHWRRFYRWLHLMDLIRMRARRVMLKRARDMKRSLVAARAKQRKGKALQRWAHMASQLFALLKKGRVLLARQRHEQFVSALETKRHFFGRWKYERDIRRFDSELMCRAILRLTLGPYAKYVQERCAVVIQKTVRGFLFRRRMMKMSRYMVMWKTRYQTAETFNTRGERLGKGYWVPDTDLNLSGFSKIVSKPKANTVSCFGLREQHADFEEMIENTIPGLLKENCNVSGRELCYTTTSQNVAPLESLSRTDNQDMVSALSFTVDCELECRPDGYECSKMMRDIGDYQAVGDICISDVHSITYPINFVEARGDLSRDMTSPENVIFVSPIDYCRSETEVLNDFSAVSAVGNGQDNDMLYELNLDFSDLPISSGFQLMSFEACSMDNVVVDYEGEIEDAVSASRWCNVGISKFINAGAKTWGPQIYGLPELAQVTSGVEMSEATKQQLIESVSRDCFDYGFFVHTIDSHWKCCSSLPSSSTRGIAFRADDVALLPYVSVGAAISELRHMTPWTAEDMRRTLCNSANYCIDAPPLSLSVPRCRLPLDFHMRSLMYLCYVIIPFAPTDDNIQSLIQRNILPSVISDLPVVYDRVNEDLCQEIIGELKDCVLVESYDLNDSTATLDPLTRMTLIDTRLYLKLLDVDKLIAGYMTDSVDDMPIIGNVVPDKVLHALVSGLGDPCSVREFAECDLSILLEFVLTGHVERMDDDEAWEIAANSEIPLPIGLNCVTDEHIEIMRGYDLVSYSFVSQYDRLPGPLDRYEAKDPEAMIHPGLLDALTDVMFPDLPIVGNTLKEDTIDQIVSSLRLRQMAQSIIDEESEINIDMLLYFGAMDLLGYVNMLDVDKVMANMFEGMPIEENSVLDTPEEIVETIDLFSAFDWLIPLHYYPSERLSMCESTDPLAISDWNKVNAVCECLLDSQLNELPIQRNTVTSQTITDILSGIGGIMGLHPFDYVDIDPILYYLQAPIPVTDKTGNLIAMDVFDNPTTPTDICDLTAFESVDISALDGFNWHSLSIIPNRDVVQMLADALLVEHLADLPIQANDIDHLFARDCVTSLVSPTCVDIVCNVGPIKYFTDLDNVLPYDRGILDHEVASLFLDLIDHLPIVPNTVDSELVSDVLDGVSLDVPPLVVNHIDARRLAEISAKDIPIPVDEKFFNCLIDVIMRKHVLPYIPIEQTGECEEEEPSSASEIDTDYSSATVKSQRHANLLDAILDSDFDDLSEDEVM